MNERLNNRVGKTQDAYESYFKEKVDILSLKKKPNTKVEWPIQTYRQTYQNSNK